MGKLKLNDSSEEMLLSLKLWSKKVKINLGNQIQIPPFHRKLDKLWIQIPAICLAELEPDSNGRWRILSHHLWWNQGDL